MNITLVRTEFTEQSTIGKLYVNGVYFCDTLEDKLRPKGVKVMHKTCIPAGTYEVIINWSNRFGQFMPLLLAVVNFVGIRIHSGNTAVDTSGCILVGKRDKKDRIINSRTTYQKLFGMMKAVAKKQKIKITIMNQAPKFDSEATDIKKA